MERRRATRREEQLLLRYLVLNYEKLTRPYMDFFREKLSGLQLTVLGLLMEYGTMTMTRLAEKLHTTRQQMTQVVSRLCDVGFTARVDDPKDRRVVLVELLPPARDFLERAGRENLDGLLAEIASLGEEEYERFLSAVEVISSVLAQVASDGTESRLPGKELDGQERRASTEMKR